MILNGGRGKSKFLETRKYNTYWERVETLIYRNRVIILEKVVRF